MGHERVERVAMDSGSPAAHGKYVDQAAMDAIRREMAAYDEMRAELEAEHLGKWVIVRNRELVDIYETFEDAAEAAIARFGRGPYHIREVGMSPFASCHPRWRSVCSNAVRRVWCVRVPGGPAPGGAEVRSFGWCAQTPRETFAQHP